MSENLHTVMTGQGYYNFHSQTQALVLTKAFPFLEAAAQNVPLPETNEPFCIADLGSAQGRNSLEPMKRIVSILRKRQADLPVQITHTDQAANDFSSLFELLENNSESYLKLFSDTYCAAVGRSFFQRIFPAHSIDLMWSSVAVHWLSRIPVTLSGHIWLNYATGPALEAFRNQAREDWKTFLTHRAAELKPGGRIVTIATAADDHFKTGGEPLVNLVNQVAQELVEKKFLEPTEYDNFTVPVYSRTLKEYLEPFEEEPLKSILKVEGARLDAAPDFQCEAYRQNKDAQEFSKNVTGFLRAFTEILFLAALNPKRSESEKKELAQKFYGTIQAKILADPEKVQVYWNVASLHLIKK